MPADATPVLPLLVQRVVERYVGAFAPERIVLFGSWAKGTRRPRSDIDLLVVTEAAAGATAPHVRARQLAADCFPSIDVVLATPTEVAAAPAAPSPFLASILGSGIDLYIRNALPLALPTHREGWESPVSLQARVIGFGLG